MKDVQRFADAMRAECAESDLVEGPLGVHVLALREDGTHYELGSVSEAAIYQDPAGAMAAISRIKFAATQPAKEPNT